MGRFRNIYFCLVGVCLLCASCSSYQPVKNVWKSTKGLWNTYVSTPASVDYDDKGELSPYAKTLAQSMKGIDSELSRLERAMQNADKPPTQEWLDNLFASFPWLNGFAGIKYDGTILGQQPAESMKDLDFNPLLYEDKKQGSRALRADIEPSPLGPEIMLATPLYDGIDFLGIVVAYFDMRSLMRFSSDPSAIVILSPTALLWPGKYDFAATPLAGVDWSKVVAESHAGTCTNPTGSFFYLVRYLGNLPLVFAIPENGNFPEGDGGLEQASAYFPQSREKLPPPPAPERKPQRETSTADFARREDEEIEEQVETAQQEAPETPSAERSTGRSPNEIEPGSRDSVLLKSGQGGKRRQVEERQLEGEDVPVERVERPRRPARTPIVIETPQEPEPEVSEPVRMPSPFGPEEKTPEPEPREFVKPSPFGPPAGASEPSRQENKVEATTAPPVSPPEPTSQPSATEEKKETGSTNTPARMPDGRPSPFGPPASE